MPKRVFVFDLDGTLFDNGHRQHFLKMTPKDWGSFNAACDKDEPIPHMIELAVVLGRSYSLLFVSGREESMRAKSEAMLRQYGLLDGNRLFVRPDGDYRADDVVKREILDRILGEGYEIIMVFDDRTRVVKMWRARGIPCAQVAEGDF